MSRDNGKIVLELVRPADHPDMGEEFVHGGRSPRVVRRQIVDAVAKIPDDAPIAEISKMPSLKISSRASGATWHDSAGNSGPLITPIIMPAGWQKEWLAARLA